MSLITSSIDPKSLCIELDKSIQTNDFRQCKKLLKSLYLIDPAQPWILRQNVIPFLFQHQAAELVALYCKKGLSHHPKHLILILSWFYWGNKKRPLKPI